MRAKASNWKLASGALAAFAVASCGGTNLQGDGDTLDASDASAEAADEAADVLDLSDVPPWESVTLPPACGDGVVDPGEECDDGNRRNGDDCDWQCRAGSGSFEYPPPDPDVRPIEAAGPPVTVAPEDEGIEGAGMRLNWGIGGFGLTYAATQPVLAVRFRILDSNGATVAGPWEEVEAWEIPQFELAATDTEFGLFTQQGMQGPVFLTRLDATANPVAPRREIRAMPVEAESWRLLDAVWTVDRFVLACHVPGGFQSLDALSPVGDLLRDTVWIGPLAYWWLLPLDDGVALAGGPMVTIFDLDLRVTGWSGFVPGEYPSFALAMEFMRNVVATEDGFLQFWIAYPEPYAPLPADLWVAGFDRAGTLTLPPRIVMPELTHDGSGFEAVYGPAGVGIIYVYSPDRTPDDVEVRIVNTDRWGNPRSAPAIVITPEDGVYSASGMEIAADDTGYGVAVGVKPFPATSTYHIVFRRYVPAP